MELAGTFIGESLQRSMYIVVRFKGEESEKQSCQAKQSAVAARGGV